MTRADVRRNDARLLVALEAEQRQMRESKNLTSSHRVVPRSLEMGEEHDPKKAWRCSNCHAVAAFPDEFDDFICTAVPLFPDDAA